MLNVVKHLECAHVDVHEILRCAQDDNTSAIFRKPILFYYNYSFLTINSPIRTTSASGKAAVSERRRRDVPSGTVGGRTGRT